MNTRTCNRCNIEKTIDNFSPTSPYKGEPRWRGECKDCNRANQKKPAAKAAQKKYRATEKYEETRQEYRSQPEVREKENQQERNRYHNNPEYKRKRITNSIVQINKKLEDPVQYGIWLLKNKLRDWVKSKGENKTKKQNYIGCTKEEFRTHIEKQFTPEMNWKNHAEYWEYDHIIPISSAKTMEEAYKLTHYTNIRPLHWLENVRKSDKLPEET